MHNTIHDLFWDAITWLWLKYLDFEFWRMMREHS